LDLRETPPADLAIGFAPLDRSRFRVPGSARSRMSFSRSKPTIARGAARALLTQCASPHLAVFLLGRRAEFRAHLPVNQHVRFHAPRHLSTGEGDGGGMVGRDGKPASRGSRCPPAFSFAVLKLTRQRPSGRPFALCTMGAFCLPAVKYCRCTTAIPLCLDRRDSCANGLQRSFRADSKIGAWALERGARTPR